MGNQKDNIPDGRGSINTNLHATESKEGSGSPRSRTESTVCALSFVRSFARLLMLDDDEQMSVVAQQFECECCAAIDCCPCLRRLHLPPEEWRSALMDKDKVSLLGESIVIGQHTLDYDRDSYARESTHLCCLRYSLGAAMVFRFVLSIFLCVGFVLAIFVHASLYELCDQCDWETYNGLHVEVLMFISSIICNSIALFSMATLIATIDIDKRFNMNSYIGHLLKQPKFWLLTLLTCMFITVATKFQFAFSRDQHSHYLVAMVVLIVIDILVYFVLTLTVNQFCIDRHGYLDSMPTTNSNEEALAYAELRDLWANNLEYREWTAALTTFCLLSALYNAVWYVTV